MATYTVEAFRWSGTGYNAQYNTSHTAVITDNDPAYQGSGDADETISIDGAAAGGTAGPPYVITVSFTDTGGNPQVEAFEFFNTGGNWYFIPGPGSSFTIGAMLGSYQSHTVGWNYASVVCFVRGARIATKTGPVKVERLGPGDDIVTSRGVCKPLRLVVTRKVSSLEQMDNRKLRPVKIEAGALGNGLPERDLWVSRQHRMLVASPITHRMFDEDEVLVAAIKLTGLPGVAVDDSCQAVEYFHLLFDRHEVIYAEGAPSESFFPGPQAIRSLPQAGRQELTALFPELLDGQKNHRPARFVPRQELQKRLVARHHKNHKPLFEAVFDPGPDEQDPLRCDG
jgi:hypothetical protein